MLLEIRAFNEAARALLVWIALAEDEARLSPDPKSAPGRRRSARPDHARCSRACSPTIGFANAVKAQQVLGGHGYIAEWGMEQFVRDARIAMIYEGANGVQALDLVGRKLPKDGGRAIMAFFGEISGFLAANKDDAALAPLSRRRLSPRSAICSRRRCGCMRTASRIRITPEPALMTICTSWA